MAGKFQIRSRKWDLGILVACLVFAVLGLGGLFLLQGLANGGAGGTTNAFVILLGVLTFAAFAGPGIVYVLRKRVKAVKARLPGGTMTWIRSHLYLPVLALVAAWIHASTVPFRATLTSGKALLVLGILVSIAGMARHHLIGIQKAALNVDVAIGKKTTGQPRAFRRLVADYTDNARSLAEVDQAMAGFDPSLQQRWAEIREISQSVEKHFPREGGQSWSIRQYKLWKALHPPLTIALFLVLGFHVFDVLGGTRAVADETEQFASSSECADCHGTVFTEWAGSTMAHAHTSTINEAQLPITLSENVQLIEDFDGTAELAVLVGRDLEEDSQQEIVEDNAGICIDCHAPIGGSFIDNPLALLPFGDEGTAQLGEDGVAVSGGNEAVTSDGIGCVVCHTVELPPAERAGNEALVSGAVQATSGGGYGTVYGPLFTDPNPLPVRIHGIETPDDSGFWTDPLETSQICGACHNVKLDIDGDGLTPVDGADEQGIVEILDALDDGDDLDADDDFQLDENELDDNRVQQDLDGDGTPDDDLVNDAVDNDGDGVPDGGDGLIDDLVLQTTYDEWQDYVAYFDADGGFEDRYADVDDNPVGPLGCTDCHMPLGEDPTEAVVDYAPGVLSIPERLHRQHTFVGVDYDLDPEQYRKNGLSDEDIARVVAERDALVQSAATVEVFDPVTLDTPLGTAAQVDIEVRNNQMAHAFPTGFAFARQFWLEVSAETRDGSRVCLAPPFVDVDDQVVGPVSCSSGFADLDGDEPIEGDAELRQCDTRAFSDEVAGLEDGVFSTAFDGFAFPNVDIDFAEGGDFAPDECDPWLANFQKILTDGNPDGDDVRAEVPYQPVLPDAVKIRGRLANGQLMTELQPVRIRDNDGDGALDASDRVVLPYVFLLVDEDGNQVDPADLVVTARLRFRHLPPYFIRDLARRQADVGDDVPEGARIDAAELLSRMVVAEVVTATNDDDGPQLECEGPQNGEDTILSCIDDAEIADLVDALGFGDTGEDRSPVDRPAVSHEVSGYLRERVQPTRGSRRRPS